MAADRELIEAIRAELRRQADPALASGMQAYMKSAMPYLGVRVPQVRAVVRSSARATSITDSGDLVDTVHALWVGATHREDRYAATALLDVPALRRLRTTAFVDLYAELIVDGAWWDHVDELAHRVGDLLLAHRGELTSVLRQWSSDPDVWLRRVSIIAQLGHKERTDVTLLTDAIEPNAADREFFIRKAIGWSLRDYARTAPDWVRRFVATHELQPLSVREATKHL